MPLTLFILLTISLNFLAAARGKHLLTSWTGPILVAPIPTPDPSPPPVSSP
jgi:hypothetical protein